MKSLFVLRCHQFKNPERYLLNFVEPYFGQDNILVVADERNYQVNTGKWKKAALNQQRIKELGILNHQNCGWLCGDYFLYIAQQACPDYDFYWLCEPDVYFSFKTAHDFFKEFENKQAADLFAPFFGKRLEHWLWSKMVEVISKDVYGCLFPIVRVSRKAVCHLLAERVLLTNLFLEQNLSHSEWPNDESYVCTTLQRDKFLCRNINDIQKFLGPDFGLTPILWDVAINGPHRNRVLHPVVPATHYHRKFSLAFKNEFSPQIKKYFSEKVFQNSESRHFSDILINAVTAVYEDARSALPISGENINDDIKRVDDFIQSAKALKSFAIKQHTIMEKRNRLKIAPALPIDFELDYGNPTQAFDKSSLSPYAFDYDTSKFIFTQNDKSIIEKPFFYQAQFENAAGIVTLPLGLAEEKYGPSSRLLNPTFIFSIGRCGSTLLSKLTRCVGKSSVSEPDIFTVFGSNKGKLSPSQANDVLFYTVKSLEAFFGVPTAQLVIKLRSSCNGVCGDIHRNFPNAKYIFMIRELSSWSESFIKKFNWDKHLLFNTLVEGINALFFFKKHDIDIHLIAYEDLVADPASFLSILLDSNNGPGGVDQDLLKSIMSTHSQTGTGLEEEPKGNAEALEKRVLEFLEFWGQNKPINKLQYIGLDI